MGELFIGLWQFCVEFIADRLGVHQKRSIWTRLAVALVSIALGVALAAVVWMVVAALIIVPKVIISG